MGLRDRLKGAVKGVLGAAPVATLREPAAVVAASGTPTAPTAPVAVAQAPSPPPPVAVAQAPSPPPVAVAQAPSPPPEAVAPAAPEIAAPTVRFSIDSNDAPVRNSHVAAPVAATGQGFRVHLSNPDERFDLTVVVEPGEFILDAVERVGSALPFSCRNGGCLTCTGRVRDGTYQMEEQYTLEPEQIERGFFLICCARPTSEMDILTHQQDAVE
jgi:ferredoxin